MQITQNMQSYIQDLKSLSEVSNFKNFNKTDKAFELIYKKAKDANVDLSNAKKFLSSLSDAELSTLQKNKSLAEPINVTNLSGEGAYNLLVHGYECQQKADKTKVALEKKIPQHESRYETLMKMNHNNMTLAQHTEFSHLSANRPLDFLSDEANKALAKSLEGKSDEEKGQIKAIISLEFTISVKMDNNGNIVHGARDFSKKNHEEVMSKIHKIINNTQLDTIGTIDVLKDFLSLYTHDEKKAKSSTSPLRDMLNNSNSGDKNAS